VEEFGGHARSAVPILGCQVGGGFVFGGQVGYESDCKCFHTTDKIMVFDVHHAEEDLGEEVPDGNAGMVPSGSGIVRVMSVAVAGLVWLAL